MTGTTKPSSKEELDKALGMGGERWRGRARHYCELLVTVGLDRGTKGDEVVTNSGSDRHTVNQHIAGAGGGGARGDSYFSRGCDSATHTRAATAILPVGTGVDPAAALDIVVRDKCQVDVLGSEGSEAPVDIAACITCVGEGIGGIG
jgi:hypothetical protein